jgi:hypothetical protein
MSKQRSSINAFILICTFFIGCKKENDVLIKTFYGPRVQLGADSARSFITLGADGQPSLIGIQLGENALNNLPEHTIAGMRDHMYPLLLPVQAKASGLDHLEINWNPMGHEPFPYLQPHFDFHFYYVGQQERSKIIPGPDTVGVPKQYVPTDYISTVTAEPNMGVHWIDTTSSELHSTTFTQTLIYGFYKGNMTFIEPMVTRAFLQTRPNFSASIKQPAAFQLNNYYYPRQYHIKYDETKHEYQITLAGLIKK